MKQSLKYNYDLFTSGLLRLNSKNYNTIKLFSFFCFETENGMNYGIEEVCELLNLREEEYNKAFDEIVERGFLKFDKEAKNYSFSVI